MDDGKLLKTVTFIAITRFCEFMLYLAEQAHTSVAMSWGDVHFGCVAIGGHVTGEPELMRSDWSR